MKAYRILTILLFTLFTTSCTINLYPIHLQDVPIDATNLDTILISVKAYVEQHLPQAEYRSAIYKGTCDSLLEMSGELVVLFVQVNERPILIQEQILVAFAVVDISSETLDLTIRDETDAYFSVKQYPLVTDEYFNLVAHATYNQILMSGNISPECYVTLTQLETAWIALWNSGGENGQQYQFCINSESFEIVDCP